MRHLRGPALLVASVLALVAVTGCSKSPVDEPGPSSRATTTTRPAQRSTTITPAPTETPSVTAVYGCGPTDAPEVTITGREVGTDPVVLEVLYDGTVTARSEPVTGPVVQAVLNPNLPEVAYQAGQADARIVPVGDEDRPLTGTSFSLKLITGCG